MWLDDDDFGSMLLSEALGPADALAFVPLALFALISVCSSRFVSLFGER